MGNVTHLRQLLKPWGTALTSDHGFDSCQSLGLLTFSFHLLTQQWVFDLGLFTSDVWSVCQAIMPVQNSLHEH